ncbi:MAG: pyridoxal phosphate-dependent aminotransferase, partial [Armatimonadota bacterium]
MASVRDLMRPTVGEIRPYREGKSYPGAVKLSANENPLGPSPKAVQAMRELAPKVRLYPDPLCIELTERLAEHLGVGTENLIVGRGSDEVIHMLGLTFLRAGDEVIYANPPFALYPFTAKLMDCKSVVVPVKDFAHDLPAMAAAITERTRLIFVANPHNPTGTIVPRAEAEAFVRDLPGHVIVAWDAAYHEYATNEEYVDPLGWVEQHPNVIVLRTFSKVYALAGLRVGYGVAEAELIEVLTQVREPFNVSSVAQVAALA